MNHFKSLITRTVGLLSLSILLPVVSYADTGDAYINNSSPKPWVVLSNGSSYVKFNHLLTVTVIGRLKYDTGTAGRVKSWWAKPILTNGYGIGSTVPGLNYLKKNKSYSAGSRPKKINKSLTFYVPASKVGPAAIAMCNWKANTLRKQGMSNQQIFSVNREVTFKASLSRSVNANGAGSNNALWQYYAPYTIKVRCAKWAGAKFPTAGGFTTNLRVIKATMIRKIIKTITGVCKVKLTTAISTNKPNALIRFRYKSPSKQSNIFSVTTKANKIAVVTHTWNIQNNSGPFDGTWIHMAGVTPSFKSNTVSAWTECSKKGPTGLKPNTRKNPRIKGPTGLKQNTRKNPRIKGPTSMKRN